MHRHPDSLLERMRVVGEAWGFIKYLREAGQMPEGDDDLKPIKEIVHRAFRRTYQKEVKQLPLAIERSVLSNTQPDEKIENVDPEGVGRMATMLEATLAMSDGIADDEVIKLEVPLGDLRSFVCYMRELDLSYRKILDIAADEVEKAKKKRETPQLVLPTGVKR